VLTIADGAFDGCPAFFIEENENQTGLERGVLQGIVDALYEGNGQLVVTSSLQKNEFGKHFDPALCRRIAALCWCVPPFIEEITDPLK
jgi:hypothetical protein